MIYRYQRVLKHISICLFAVVAIISIATTAKAFDPSFRVMTYNVLYYGDNPPCQGAHAYYHAYLRQIVAYSTPDIVGLEKVDAIPLYVGDNSGSAPYGFVDSILDFAFNVHSPGKYACGPYTNNAGANNVDLLIYNTHKFGCVGVVSAYSNITDFDTYKLFYKDSNLAVTHDTLFLYVTLNHTNSGSSSSDVSIRGDQITGEMNAIATKFSALPNMINMGDFNTHNSIEACYQTLVNPTDTNYRFFDPPFAVEHTCTYPADWDTYPYFYPNYLTTSTRLSGSDPNSCGTSGGGKSWYDHIFLSGPICYGTDRILYLPNSYHTLGNDGNRVGISANDLPENLSAPDSVVQSIFQMSNKYPIYADFYIAPPGTAVSVIPAVKAELFVGNPAHDRFLVKCSGITGKVRYQCTDMLGRVVLQGTFQAADQVIIPVQTITGGFAWRFFTENSVVIDKFVMHF